MKKMITTSVVGAAMTALCFAAFLPLEPKQRAAKSAMIVKGTVKKVQILFDAPLTKGVGQVDGYYLGPRSVAVVDIEEVWKMPEDESCFLSKDLKRRTLPMQVLVPCDYTYHESPSDLTEGTTYILFLAQMGSNFYHPIDPASTHVIHEGRVARFGMNHRPEKDFATKSVPLSEFRRQVLDHLKP